MRRVQFSAFSGLLRSSTVLLALTKLGVRIELNLWVSWADKKKRGAKGLRPKISLVANCAVGNSLKVVDRATNSHKRGT